MQQDFMCAHLREDGRNNTNRLPLEWHLPSTFSAAFYLELIETKVVVASRSARLDDAFGG